MTSRQLLDDCFLHDKDRLSHDECLALICARLTTVTDTEPVSSATSSGRFLAEKLIAPRNVPMHTNSAVDGYAFAYERIPVDGAAMPVTARIAAGDRKDYTIGPGEAARIFTGATIPSGTDTVVMQEDCETDGDATHIVIPSGLKKGANVRRAGEDLQKGDTVLEPGALLRPQDIAAIASLGIAIVNTRKPLRIALASSGDELVQPGKPLQAGMVYDSNRAMLAALANSLPVSITDLGVMPDNPGIVENTLLNASRSHDLLITTGGASRGEEDHIVTAVANLGKRHLWQIAVKPGRPMTMGQIGKCVMMGLPGNPVAAFVCFLLYCRPAITILAGGKWREPIRYPLPAGFEISRKKKGRREFWRGWLEMRPDGQLIARKFGRDGSGLISGLRQATGLIEAGEDVQSISEGDMVDFIPFEAFGIRQ